MTLLDWIMALLVVFLLSCLLYVPASRYNNICPTCHRVMPR
jgi:hypothetical protein